jgi:hypothetical protein
MFGERSCRGQAEDRRLPVEAPHGLIVEQPFVSLFVRQPYHTGAAPGSGCPSPLAPRPRSDEALIWGAYQDFRVL